MVTNNFGFPADAGGGNRTHTLLREPDFESGASASSATPAIKGNNIIGEVMRQEKRDAEKPHQG